MAFPEDFGRDLDSQLIVEDPMRVALPPGHPLAASKTVDLSALSDEEWLCGDKPSACREHVINACRMAGFEPRISFESDDYQVIQGLVAAGLGVGLIPELAAWDPNVELREIEPHPPIRRVWAITREAGSRSPASEEMLAILDRVGEDHAKGHARLRAAA